MLKMIFAKLSYSHYLSLFLSLTILSQSAMAQSVLEISVPELVPKSVRQNDQLSLESVSTAHRWGRAADLEKSKRKAYDLEMLLGLASQNNPTIRQARLQISGTLAQAQQAGFYPNPTLAYLAENINSGGTPGEFQGAELEQRIVTADKLALSRNKYLQRAKVAEHLAVAQQFKVCNDVRIHFIQTLAAQDILALRHEMLKTAQDQMVTTKELFNLGQANQVDLRKAVADLRRHQLDVLAAENKVRQQFYTLTSLVGVELVPGRLEGSLETHCGMIDFDSAYATVLVESPELLAAYAKLKEDHITVHRENVEWVPDIVVSGGSGYNFESQDPVANFSVRLEVPLYERNQGTIRQAQADEHRQRQEIRRIEMLLRMKLSEQYDTYITALQKVETYNETILPESKKAYEQSLISYKNNREEWPVVLNDHREYTMRRMEQIDNHLKKRSAEILINGYLLNGGLDAAPSPTPPGHIDSTPKPR
ncbi:TolC family protein [Rubinisphaera sp.]|uniref:TolC family protein n=1 Tax=Rubinisphaera sp. TaxID=2024857 RepID=UPI000C0F9706|nr:TolC family protein [Rubinisphaera sp.]MBV09881.1 transporter [Rubinisphaera sp.]HCS50528.1 TolC family protein [Planctomycetaceae bacterium]